MDRLSISAALARSPEARTCRAEVAPSARPAPPRPDGRASLSPDPASPAARDPRGCSSPFPRRASLRRRLRPRENAATLLRGARACLALLAAAALLALAAPAQAQTEVWTATLTPGDLNLSILGCGNHIDSARCSSTTVLSEDSFNYDSTDYTITKLFVRSGGHFQLDFDADITTATAALTLVVGSTSLVLADADTIASRQRIWHNSGVSLTEGTDIVVKLTAPAADNPPTAANNTVTTGEDRPYTFMAADFSFMDADAGAALASVKIVTVPAAGTLALDGTAVTALDDVTKAQIDGDMLTFTPAQDAHGVAYTTFTFKVNDGTVDSASAYTMSIDVTDAPVPVCTAPSFGDRREIWTGTVTVEEFTISTLTFHGYSDGVQSPGELDDTTFSIGSNDYTISSVAVEFGGTYSGTLSFDLTNGTQLTALELAALRLHVCDTPFDFSDALSQIHSHGWRTSLDWSDPVVTRTVYLSLPANNPATGEPTITGTARAEQDLTADASPILDTDGLPSSFTYQWLRVDADGTSDEEDISGEIAETYTLATDDVGKKVKVKVGFTDELSGEEERTSAAYPSSGTVTAAGGTNTAPVFSSSNVSRSIAENTAAGQNVGAAVTATDADAGDTLGYELGGTDAASFDIVGTSGQIRTKTNVSYDFEAKSSYTVTVTASDGTDTAVATVTISVTDADEPPDAPSAISVTAVTDSSTSLTVSWTAPANDGKPDIESYDVQYRLSGATAWTDGPEDVTGTTTTVSGLTADTEYQVQVRAANDEGESDWSDPPGSGQTNIMMLSTNAPPTAADKTVTTTRNRNYTFLTTDFGFEDADSGAALASVKIVTLPAVGNLALDGTDVTLNQVVTRAEIDAANLKFEPATDASGTGYASFDFKVNDGTDDSVSAYTMTIDVANVTAPGAPTALTATASGQAWIELAWTAPVHAGGRAITGYRIEVSPDGSSSWSELVLVATTTRSTATTYVHKGLNAGATRHYRVSAINVVGASDPSGSDHASTRTDEQLVSNFDYFGTADNIHLAIQNVVGIFTTGSRDAKLNSIELKLGKFNNRTVAPELKLYVLNLNSSGRATLGEQVATLATPTTSLPRHSFRTFNYEAPSGTRLSASEEYIFVLEPPTIGIILVETTTDPSEDDVKADGWTIDGSGHGLEPFYIGSTRQIVFRVNGTLTPNTAPTAAHNTVTMAEDGRYEFSATDFRFHDTNPADRLVSVRIETLPALGALALDGADVTLNQVVTKTQIDAGDLTFRPAAGGSGNNYARFNFKVNDGTVFSASAYTMRIDVTPTPPLTGQIFVDNTAETDYLRTVADNRSSQSFTTGPNRGGYILTSIGVVAQIVGENGVDDFSVAVHNADANGAPVALHTSLIPPGNFPEEVSTIHFHAPSNTRLRPNTTYSIVLGSGRTPSRFRQISATQSNADNASGSGWSIGDALHSRRSAASPWSSPNDGRSVKIVIRGNTASGVANNAPVFSPATVDRSIAENTAAGRNVGAVVTATDADNDPLTYTLGGADMASFDIDEFSGQIRTKAGVSYDHEAKPSYTVTVTASDGIATADADVTISVTDVNEPPRAPATPVVSAVAQSAISLTVTWAAPANAGRPAIDSYDVQYRASGATDWIDGPDHSTTTAVTGLVAYTLHAARVTGLIANTEYEARVRAVNDEGNSGWSTPPGAGRTNTLTNNAPVFSPAIVGRSIAENTAADVDIGLPVTATDDDAGDTLGYTLGGAGAEFFDFVEASGQIRTKADVSYDFEARSSYTVTVTASDGTVSAAAIVTISVIDVAEPPDAPATPEVTPVTGSTTSLAVSWAAPDNDGRPAIDGYDVQYRVGGSGTWTDVPQVVTGTTATITGLTAATDYQVQVRAANAEGDSGWSDPPGAGRTHPLTHIAPMFSSSSQTRDIAENTGAGVNVGAAVTATDVNNDPLGYTLGGADAGSFDFVETTGQILTKTGVSYNHEAKPSYTVTVTASDGAATAVATVTINVTDVAEPPDAPATPIVSAVAGSTHSLSVSWTAPANEGRPPIESYSVQWRVSGATVSRAKAVDAPTTTTIISELLADTEYEVRVNATNDEGNSGFSDPPWVGRTSTTLTNNVPVFSSSNVALSIAENTAAGVAIGAAVTATDADAGDTLTYTLRGADAEFFDIVDTTGQIRTKDNVSYDFEAKPAYTVTVRVSDGDATAEASVIISITDVDEAPAAPATPTVSAVADSTTRLTVSWDAPANAGKPDIDSYDVQYRLSGATAWINGPRNVATTTTTVTGLTANTLYEAQVRATNHEGDSGWSDPPGSGRTNSATTNNAPVFSSSNVTRDIAENTAAGRNVGAAVAATDDDGDTLGYTLGGADVAFFDFVETTGQILTKAGVSYDHEAKDSYTVTVTASDGTATAVADVTIGVTDVDEPPSAPATPMVSAVSGSTTRLSVSWAAPANAGKPAIANYDVQYRVGSSGTWSDGPEDVTGTTTTVSGLVADTLYEARVRASNAEGDSGWSEPPGSGRTNTPSNNAPVFDPAMPEREIAENTAAGVNVGAPVTATDADAGDTLSYTLGGADVASFDFVETTGQIRTKAGVSYDHEAKSSYTVTVTATDGTSTADASVTISVTDVDEPPSAPATPMVSAVSGSTTRLTVSWAAPANDGKPAIASYDVQYRVGSSGTWSDGPEDVTGTTTAVSGLVADTLYEARVRATNAEGDSGWSEPPGSGRTNAPTTSAPGAPGDLRTTPGDGRVTLAWTAPESDGGAAILKYQYRAQRTGTTAWTDVPDGPDAGGSAADETTFTVSGLSNGTEYVFQLRAVNSVGEGRAASATGTPVRAPLPPGSGFLVSNFGQPADGASQISVTQDIVGVFTTGARGAELHNIEFRLFSRLPNIAQLPSATLYRASVTDTRATPGTRVATLTAAPGSPRPAATAQTVAFTAPGGTRLEAGATYLVVLEGSGNVRVESTTFPAEDAGGAPGWAIDGIGAGNSSPYSYQTTASLLMRVNGTAAGATVATAPDAPASLGAAARDARVNLIWTPPRSDGGAGIEKYQYRYSAGSRVDPDTAWTDVPDGSDSGTSRADERSVSVTELDNGRQYAFELRAVNGVRAGAAATATATPAAARRTGFLVSNFGQPVDGASQIYVTQDIVGAFTAGALGATLDSIELRLYSRTPDIAQLPSATLYRGSVTDTRATPGTRVATLTAAPGSPRPAASAQTIVFTAPGGTRLEAGATYLVVLAGSGYVRVEDTNSSAQDAGGASGWTIDGVGAGNSSPYSYGTSDSLLMSVNGTTARAQREEAAKDEQQEEEQEEEPATSPDPDRGISLSTSSSSAIEGQAATISVRRAGPTDRTTSVAVQVFDSALTGAWPIDLDFRSGVATVTATVAIPFDGARPASRTVTVRLASVEEPYSVGSPSTLTFNVTDRDAALSVDDASVSEGPGATLAFAVTLDRTRDREVRVKYATSDGTATQGEDYTGVSGTLRFAPGETSKTVSVTVLDDAHDEGSETLTLTLSNARGAVIDDATAVGTINNFDPMPNAWLSRFGRVASDQVVQSIGRRLDGGARESHLTVMGWRVDALFDSRRAGRVSGEELEHEAALDSPRFGRDGAELRAGGTPGAPGGFMAQGEPGAGALQMTEGAPDALRAAPGVVPVAVYAPGVRGRGGPWAEMLQGLLMKVGAGGDVRAPGLRDMVMGSSFYYGHSPDAGLLRGMNRLTAWGESASTRFSGAEGKLSLDGEVNTAILGADGEWGRWLAGLALSYSEGEGGYRRVSAKGGAVSSTLSGINPYARYRLDERTSLWATLGYGSGRLTLTPDGAESVLETDMTNTMAAFGGRGVLSMRAGETGQFELALRTDAMLTNTASMAVAGLSAGEGATSRIRLILEGSGSLPAFGGVLAPKVEAGLRYDGGDAETGAGLEVGGGLAYEMARLTVQVDGRVLLTHRDRDYEEWGYSLSFVYQPGEDGRGLRYQAGSQWGTAQSGVQSLWSLQNAGGLANAERTAGGQRYTAELGYGFGERRLWYPYVATESGGASSQALRFGLKLNAASDLEAGLEIGRRPHMSGQIENDIRLQWSARW